MLGTCHYIILSSGPLLKMTLWRILLLLAASVSIIAANKGENYQYVNVPAHGVYEHGYKRGNPSHFQERYEKLEGPKFKTKVRWGDHKGGYGEHYFDYNHADKHHGKEGHH